MLIRGLVLPDGVIYDEDDNRDHAEQQGHHQVRIHPVDYKAAIGTLINQV